MSRYAERLGNPSVSDRVRGLVRSVRYGNSLPRTLTPVKDLLRQNCGRPILDVGGGFGDNYITLQKYLGDSPYTVVDGPESCRLGQSLLAGRVDFRTEIPSTGRYGLSIVVGTLQYVLEPSSFIASLSHVTDDMVYVSRSPLRKKGSDYFTIQDITPEYGDASAGECAVVIRSVDNVIGDFDQNGFELAELKEVASYRDQMVNLPGDYADCSYFNMIFRKRALLTALSIFFAGPFALDMA